MPARQALQHVVSGGKHISHVVKTAKPKPGPEKRQAHSWETEAPRCSQTAPYRPRENPNPGREALLDLTRIPDGSFPTGKEMFRQWNQRDSRTDRLRLY